MTILKFSIPFKNFYCATFYGNNTPCGEVFISFFYYTVINIIAGTRFVIIILMIAFQNGTFHGYKYLIVFF